MRNNSCNNLSFHPEINIRSKKMQRKASVEDILYEDAEKRKEKLNLAQISQYATDHNSSINVLKTSERLLASKLIEEL